MRIYLACTVRGDRGGVRAGRAICERLQHHGHEVLTTHLLADDVETAESALTETDVFRRDLEWLTACDVLVAEASGSSYGVGFEVGYVLGRARATGQRVVLLYDTARRDRVSRLITGNDDGACTTFGYGSIEELTAFIDRTLGCPPPDHAPGVQQAAAADARLLGIELDDRHPCDERFERITRVRLVGHQPEGALHARVGAAVSELMPVRRRDDKGCHGPILAEAPVEPPASALTLVSSAGYDPEFLATNVSTRPIPLSSIRDAAGAVYRAAIRTPLIRVEFPNAGATGGTELYLKLETLQPIGSFKIRGAYNVVRQLTPEQLQHGVWTVSAGNAAQGVAFAARSIGARCSVMVMDTAPETKIRAIERLGAVIVRATYDECWKTVESHGSERMTGHFVHPFDDDRFIAGNATAGLEILEDLPDVGAIVAPLGGGGLLAGLAAVVRELKPDTRVYAAEPETAAPLAASLAAGRPMYFDNWKASFVDGAGGKSVLETMWPLLAPLSGSLVVSLDEVARAMKLVAERAHVIAEGAAGCAVAAALSGRAGGGKVVAVVSGGNIDLPKFAALVGACDQ